MIAICRPSGVEETIGYIYDKTYSNSLLKFHIESVAYSFIFQSRCFHFNTNGDKDDDDDAGKA